MAPAAHSLLNRLGGICRSCLVEHRLRLSAEDSDDDTHRDRPDPADGAAMQTVRVRQEFVARAVTTSSSSQRNLIPAAARPSAMMHSRQFAQHDLDVAADMQQGEDDEAQSEGYLGDRRGQV